MFTSFTLEQAEALYSHSPAPRLTALIEAFEKRYGERPVFIARAPGRVNIIGEHIDYEGYGVLPAAIEKDCLIASRPNGENCIRLCHLQTEIYPSVELPVDPNAKFPIQLNHVKYFWAGYRAGTKGKESGHVGMDLLMEGNVPIAAGLSSSSALCVCAALTAFQANGGKEAGLTKEGFIERVITGQRQTGTASGGMDQSISVMGQRDFCLYIQFNPIRCSPVHLPAGARFVVMNSLVESAKLQTAVYRYNKRVCECRIALAILANKLNVKLPEGVKFFRVLRQLQEWSGLPLHVLGDLVDSFLPYQDYSPQQIEKLIAPLTLSELLGDIQLQEEVQKANSTYRLHQAAKHVFDEAYRVIHFIEVCKSKLQDSDKLVLLGKLMNSSQQSCRDLYDCSCPEIDAITKLAVQKGAYGSRLTGAGWGGCTVSLVDQTHSAKFIADMVASHYMSKPQLKEKIEKAGIQNVVFESIPSEGACIITI